VSAATSLVRAQLERQLTAVVGFLDDHELDELLDLAVARVVDPPPVQMLPGGVDVHQVDAPRVRVPGQGATPTEIVVVAPDA
jgi:hypothetical protein